MGIATRGRDQTNVATARSFKALVDLDIVGPATLRFAIKVDEGLFCGDRWIFYGALLVSALVQADRFWRNLIITEAAIYGTSGTSAINGN